MNLFRVFVNLFRFNRTNWKAVAGCFFAATVFWLFNALNKNYATNVRFPLKFEFDQTKFAPSRALPADIYLNVSGNGWNLFRKVLNVKLPAIVIPLERPAEIRKIVGSTMPPLLAGQIGNLKINHVVTDTLYLSIEARDSGRFKLVVDASQISYKKGYGRISPIVVLPDSILLEGPKSAIRKLTDTLALILPDKKLSSNFKEEIEVVIPNGGFIRRNPPVVEVIFEVGEIVDDVKKIQIELMNVNPLSSIVREADSISCVIQIPVIRREEFRRLTSIKAVIDVKALPRGQRKILPVITGLPPYAQITRLDSVNLRMY